VTFLIDRFSLLQIAEELFRAPDLVGVLSVFVCDRAAGRRALSDTITFSALPLPVGPSHWFVPVGFFF
jgi:hypothetical protein